MIDIKLASFGKTILSIIINCIYYSKKTSIKPSHTQELRDLFPTALYDPSGRSIGIYDNF